MLPSGSLMGGPKRLELDYESRLDHYGYVTVTALGAPAHSAWNEPEGIPPRGTLVGPLGGFLGGGARARAPMPTAPPDHPLGPELRARRALPGAALEH